jgi:ABC-type Na+ efflux pump permease subunit
MEIINHEEWNKPNPSIPVFNVDPIVVLILGFITCGLYLIYWNIKIAEVLNAVSEREVISSPIAVFAGCCYPVNVYFFYLAGKDGLPQVYKRLGYPQKDDSMLLLVLGLFFPMVAAMIVQNDINKLYN